MDIGMLWFDNDRQGELDAKVKRAVAYYQKKYGQKPNLCFVNPCMLPTSGNGSQKVESPIKTPAGIEIRESKAMLPNHFWIGIHHQKS